MKKYTSRLLAVVAVAAISVHSIANSSEMASKEKISGGESVNMPVTDLKYFDTGIGKHSGVGTLHAAPGFGDLSNGAHGTFVKMPAGFESKIHTHTGEYYAVVISGVGVNLIPGGEEVPLPVGSYWSQKGGERHITKCISQNECIFFINQTVKFDDFADDDHG
ncbi:MAG: DUF4437 domain-containing protein [Ectothiorhodospiraceae bacterium]|nr:DUF4437 domain-containing protein [Ectothiorhodospiraceae bacterium]